MSIPAASTSDSMRIFSIPEPLPAVVTSSIPAPVLETTAPDPELATVLVEKPAASTDAADVVDAGSSAVDSVATDHKTIIQTAAVASHENSSTQSQSVQGRAVVDGMNEFVTSRKTGRSYVILRTKGFVEVFAIGSGELNARIRADFRRRGKRLKQAQLDDINQELRSAAEEAGNQAEIYPRVHPLGNGGIDIDLCDGAGTTIKVTDRGWIVEHGTSQSLFLRTSSEMPLPIPVKEGNFAVLHKYVNLLPVAFLLYIAWVSYTIAHPKIESTKYVFLVLKGMQGSGKSFASKITKRLIDPNAVDAQTLPGSARELAIMLQVCQVMVVDNLRELTAAISDVLCIAATGGSVPMRKLYSDDEQKALHLLGAILFNGIHPFIGQSDFADRCLVLELQRLEPGARISEEAMWREFDADWPVILGGLYDLIVKILQRLPEVEVVAPSRMLDFCRWLAAMELALGLEAGAIQLPYAQSIQDAQLESLLDNPLAVTILEFADKMETSEWMGTPSDFYAELTHLADFSSQRSRVWPSSAAVLSKRLHGLQAPLIAQGVSIDFTRGKERQIVVSSTRPPKEVPASQNGSKSNQAKPKVRDDF
jgi:hypothetical protein